MKSRITFLLGPAGSGKTWRCLSAIRDALAQSPEGPPLLLLAPKQATFQLERQLLSEGTLAGYTRLHILSFERLAEFVFEWSHQPVPPLLSEEGRVMVLRALLGQGHRELNLFHASARLPGFARQLSALLREFQRHRLAADHLDRLSQSVEDGTLLGRKLHDFALVLRAYSAWLDAHHLQDADQLLDLAADALQAAPPPPCPSPLAFSGLWLDGFAQMTPQERRLLGAILPACQRATLAFCLERAPETDCVWHSPWVLLARTFTECHAEVSAMFDPSDVAVELLRRDPANSRFATQPALRYLEAGWTQLGATPHGARTILSAGPGVESTEADEMVRAPLASRIPHSASRSAAGAVPESGQQSGAPEGLRLVACANPETEATFAAREILRAVRGGERFRDLAVLVRTLEPYHAVLRRVFTRYEIPFFIDRREVVGHHPLAELTRSALRTVAFHWAQPDWFSVLKTGLVPAGLTEVDLLENEALARGWEGAAWLRPLPDSDRNSLARSLEAVRQRILPPFAHLKATLGSAPFQLTGTDLADALRTLWNELRVEATLEEWSQATPDAAGRQVSPPHAALHRTVWDQMQEWLDNLARAFPRSSPALPLRDWLPILDAGLSGLSVGVIPPALDHVLIGSIDRSRNPDLKRVFLLGVNEGVFPAPAASPGLLTEADRQQLERLGQSLGPNQRLQTALERYYGYIACTRARHALTLTWAQRDALGKALNPSTFISHLRRLFPGLQTETFPASHSWSDAEHPCELIAPLLRQEAPAPGKEGDSFRALADLPAIRPVLVSLRQLRVSTRPEAIDAPVAERLYGPVLATSVSQLEQFAACPFRFFVHSGLRAEERLRFELDIREQGRFQHEVLETFHHQVSREGRQWRDLTPAQACDRVGRIADELTPRFGNGMMLATDQNRFLAVTYKAALQRFIRVLVTWMSQYEFDPCAVELGFGLPHSPLPAWELDLGDGHRLAFRGRIDRVDVWRVPNSRTALCVVMDYKSGQRKLDRLLLAHGIQQQLPAYLNMLRRVPAAAAVFDADELVPAGVFFVNLRGAYPSGAHRREVLDSQAEAHLLAYRHEGLFDLAHLRKLDRRPDARTGDQFSYRLRNDGQPFKNSTTALPTADFHALLDRAEALLGELGRRVYAGDTGIDPHQKGAEKACDTCDYASVCRIDPWTHTYRVLKEELPGEQAAEASQSSADCGARRSVISTQSKTRSTDH